MPSGGPFSQRQASLGRIASPRIFPPTVSPSGCSTELGIAQVEVGDHQRKANFSEHREYSPVFLLPWRGARRAPRVAGASSPSRDRQPAAWSLACRILSAARSATSFFPSLGHAKDPRPTDGIPARDPAHRRRPRSLLSRVAQRIGSDDYFSVSSDARHRLRKINFR